MDSDLKRHVRRFFEILETRETNDDGDREFHPVVISSVRVMMTEELKHLLPEMKRLSKDDEHDNA